MNLTLTVKLMPSQEQYAALLGTLERFNEACNYIAGVAFEVKSANKVVIQKLVYRHVRETYGLSAQMTIRAIAKVVEVYKRDKSKRLTFRMHGAMVYDQRILSWKGVDHVSVLTLGGRELIPLVFGAYQAERLATYGKRGQADLSYRDGAFYLHVVVEVPEPPGGTPDEWLGVDLGIVNIATDSDGEAHSGAKVNGLRARHARLRSKLQSRGTKSAKRLLKKRSKKEARFARDVNHVIANRLIAKAIDTSRGIALENLRGIRERITVRKAQRRTQHSWGFYQLRRFLEYKSRLAGVPIMLVDPRNTSRECPACGHTAKQNRPKRDEFCCVECGYAGPADHIAAINIGSRALVNAPNVGGF